MPFTILRDDLTNQRVDAIVNAANTDLKQGGGVCGAVFKAAGEREMQAACAQLAPIRTGSAVITPGFSLPARFVIHAAGPVYRDGRSGEAALLRQTYKSALSLAAEYQLESIAFPLISSGTYGYPKAEALQIATESIRSFLDAHDLDIRLVVFDKSAFELSRAREGAVAAYIDQHYVDQHAEVRRLRLEEMTETVMQAPMSVPLDLDLRHLDDSFTIRLFQLIDDKGMSDVEVYKRANIDRRLFSKIRSNPDYSPGKRTAVSLALALELTPRETDDLLQRAGYTLSPSRIEDVIVSYFIENGIYDLFAVNEVLFFYDRPLLSS